MSDCNCQETTFAAEPTEDNICPAMGYQKAEVCVPVTVTPFAKAGTTTTTCCGKPTVDPSGTPCAGTENGVCTFTISQIICVEVPVEFGASAKVGTTHVNCLGVSSENICENCTD